MIDDIRIDPDTDLAIVPFTEAETVAMFDLMHQHFNMGRSYDAETHDEHLRTAFEKVGTARTAIYGDDEEQDNRQERMEVVLGIYGRPHDASNVPEHGAIPRYMGVQLGRDGNGTWLYCDDDIDIVLGDMAEVDGDWSPEIIVDLDTGDRMTLEIKVSVDGRSDGYFKLDKED